MAEPPSPDAFYSAYRRLAGAAAPVTAQTLRDTFPGDGRIEAQPPSNLSRRWAYKLLGLTLAVLVAIIVVEGGGLILELWYPIDGEGASAWLVSFHKIHDLLNYLLPYLYGLLGAQVALIQAASLHRRERSFDRSRAPEYWHRMLLGAVAGGTILYIIEASIFEGQDFNIASVALAFIAGYRIDLLFALIDRVLSALLPPSEWGYTSRGRASPGAPPAPTPKRAEPTETDKDKDRDKDKG